MGRTPAPKVVEYVRADGSKSFRVRLRVAGRQTTETFETRAAAQVFALQVADPQIGAAEAVRLRNLADSAASEYVPTVDEMLHQHIQQLTGVDQRTREDYVKIAGRSWSPMIGRLPINSITRLHVAQFVNAMDGKSAPRTIKGAHSLLSSVLETAILEGHITVNPARRTRLPRSGEQNASEVRYLTHAEFDRLHEAMPAHYRPFLILLFGTGLRFSEATALQVQDIDPDAVTLRVVRAWKRNDAGLHVGPPKSRASRRTIALPYEVIDALGPLMDRPGSAWLFLTVSGVPVQHSNFYNKVWAPACRRAGLEPRPRIHDARHSHASWLIAQGIRLEVIQDRLGHEDYTTTRKVYSHLMPDMRREAGLAASAAFASTKLRALQLPASSSPGSLAAPDADTTA